MRRTLVSHLATGNCLAEVALAPKVFTLEDAEEINALVDVDIVSATAKRLRIAFMVDVCLV